MTQESDFSRTQGVPGAELAGSDSLRNSDPTWVLQTAQAIRWVAYYLVAVICVTVLIFMGVMVAVGVMVAKAVQSGTPTNPDMSLLKPAMVCGIVLNVGLIVGFLVLFERLTRAEPHGRIGAPQVEMWRKLGRVLLWVMGGWTAVAIPYGIYIAWTMNLDPNHPPQTDLISALSMLVWCVLYGLLAYITALIPCDFARRLGSEALRKQAKRVLIYSVVNVVVWFFYSVFSMAITQIGSKELMPLMGCLGCPFLVFLLVGVGLQVVETAIAYPKIANLAQEQVGAAA
jgi:hypothetical protein